MTVQPSVTTPIDPAALDALLARARREVDEGLLPSCQIAVARDGEIVASETYGDRSPDQRQVIFSCSKALIAGAVWLLLADGSLRVDQPVADVIPGFGENDKADITVEQLLIHTAGFPRAPFDLAKQMNREQRIARYSSWRLNWEPGTRFEYHSTSAHWVLAELIETVSGTPYRTFVHERVLDPLGLDRLRLGEPAEHQADVIDLVVCGDPPTSQELEAIFGVPGMTMDDLVGDVTTERLISFNQPEIRAQAVPGGGGIGDADSLALYYQALLNNPDDLWDPTWLAAGTHEVRGDLPDKLTGVPSHRSLGLIIAGDPDTAAMRGFGHTSSPRAFGHAGAGGQIAIGDPDTGISFVYLTNGMDANVIREHRRTAGLASRAGLLARSLN